MRLTCHHPTTFSSLILLLPSLVASITLNCEDIREDQTSWNFKKLDNPYSLSVVDEQETKITNTTFTFNICRPLDKTKGVRKDQDCPNHTNVCAILRLTDTVENKTMITETVPIAGNYELSSGPSLNPKWKRLKSSDSPADRAKEGVRLGISGGKSDDGKKQGAFIEFLCPKPAESVRDLSDYLTAEDEEEKGESGVEIDDEHGGKIKYMSWEDEGDTKTLRLEWHTQYACEDAIEGNDKSKSGHWGFFTWFILIVFMGVAAYLIFGSWLNYNRYSARGWDLVPHSDTIRDIPYLFRDWMRRVVDTVQGGGSRGGYSAV